MRYSMAAKKKKQELDADLVVLYEDQQRINLFARKNALYNDLKAQISEREKQLQNTEDAVDELMLADDEELVPYDVGEVFVLVSNSEAQERLEEAKKSLQIQLAKLQESMAEVEEVIKTVKSQLYAKFGDNINLEPEG